MKEYDHKKIEKKWQSFWEKKQTYQAKNFSKKPKYYSLIEFPYPSGDGLHVGHPRPYIGMDIVSRKRRLEGFNVLYPIGWDAFGLPTENYAIKTGLDPRVVTKKNTDTFRRQIKSLGISFDWSREINTTDPKYYKWTQWIFLQFLKKGLAYKAKIAINWCPKDKTGLANEEVVNGCCERCGTPVEKREKEQWMLAITKYADRLDKDLDTVNYLPQIKLAQRNWIGKSEGAEIDFSLSGVDNVKHIIILHGKHGNPNNYVYPWLKEQFEKKGYTVELPALPNTEEPNDEEQADYVEKHCRLDENTAIVSHSFGGIVAMRLLERGKKIQRVVLACVPFSGQFNDNKIRKTVSDACKKGFDFKTIKKNAKEFVVLRDELDEIVPHEDANTWQKNLNGRLLDGKGIVSHFSGETEPDMLLASVPTVRVFTTRPDTIFGATYLVLAPEHELFQKLKDKISNWDEVLRYIIVNKNKTDVERTAEGKEKTGIELKGIKAINPANKEEISIWIADYVLATYGTGAIMAVPADDKRDREFAAKFKLPIIENYKKANFEDFGKKITKFKLRDWIFSRQRYWGEPIPVIHCEKCGIVPVPEKDLPVELPKVKNYQPTDSGESPLANITKWVNTKCPNCKGLAKRETDTMPNWAGSSWYYLRYTDSKNSKMFADKKNLKYWTPVDWYNGGNEHTTLHLLYSRFWHKFLFDQGLVPTSEPYKKRTSHGLILAEGGEKMSKSKGNVINPDDIVKIYGADTLRIYEMFMGPFNQSVAWSTESIIGSRRFIEKVWRLGLATQSKNLRGPRFPGAPHPSQTVANSSPASLEKLLHKTIKKVSEDIEEMHFNTAISGMMILATEMEKVESINLEDYKKFLQILSPFAPHLAEELWSVLGEKKSINLSSWPKWDENLIQDTEIKIAVQINGKVRTEIMVKTDEDEEEIKKRAISNEIVLRHVAGGSIKKVIYVKNRLINIVV